MTVAVTTITELHERIAALEEENARLREPIPDRPPCRLCGRRDGLDANLPDRDWERLGFDPGWVVCLWCIDRQAAELGIGGTIQLHFAGLALTATSDTERIADLERQVANLSACWREINKRAGQCFSDREALTRMFEDVTGQTPEQYLGVDEHGEGSGA